MSRPEKTALVLAGGGVAGAVYEIGALCAIDDLLSDRSTNDFDLYVGTSAGALVSACLANGISPHQMLQVLERAVPGLQRLEAGHIFTPNLGDLMRSTSRLPVALLDGLVHLLGHPNQLVELFDRLTADLPPGLYDTSGLESYLRAVFTQSGRTNDFQQLRKELVLIATELDTGERALFGMPPLDDVRISQAVAASAALPLIFRPYRIHSRDYFDGAMRGTASLDIAIERGATLIVCINPLVPINNRRLALGRRVSDMGLITVLNQVVRTAVHSGLHYHLKQIRRRHPEVDVILIEPQRDDVTMFADNTMRFATRMQIAHHGFQTVVLHLAAHFDEYQERLAHHGVRIQRQRVAEELREMKDRGEHPSAIAELLYRQPRGSLAGLAHTLDELERVLNRGDGARRPMRRNGSKPGV